MMPFIKYFDLSLRGMLALPHTDRYILVKKQPKTYPDDGSMTDQLCIYDVLQEEYIRRIKVSVSICNYHDLICHQ